MKRFLFALTALLLTTKAHAVLPVGNAADPIYTFTVAVTTYTMASVSVSTSAATQVDTPQLSKRTSVEVQNIDATANLWCGPTTSVALNQSRKISAGGGTWVLNIRDVSTLTGNPAIKIYCISDGTAATRATVTQVY